MVESMQCLNTFLSIFKDEEREKVGRKLKLPPRKNTIMKTLLHVTTALYSMAGLGSLEQSRAFK